MNIVYSDKGNKEINEDSYCIEKQANKQIFIVADGCGGHSSGEIASKLICDSLPSLMFECDDSIDSIKNALNLCNIKVLEQQKIHKGMRSTVVGLYKTDNTYFAFNIGDSRLYQVRKGKVVFKTQDHSVPYLLFKADIITEDEINTHEDRNKLLEAIGNKEKIKINVYSLDVMAGDIFILATDGFWVHFYIKDMEQCSYENAQEWIDGKIEYIKDKNDPEQDNYTAILVGGFDE